MGKRVNTPMWVADDGKRFATQQAMMAYESELKFGHVIDTYLDTIEFPDTMDPIRQKSQMTRIANVVLPFLLWAHEAGLLLVEPEDDTADELEPEPAPPARPEPSRPQAARPEPAAPQAAQPAQASA